MQRNKWSQARGLLGPKEAQFLLVMVASALLLAVAGCSSDPDNTQEPVTAGGATGGAAASTGGTSPLDNAGQDSGPIDESLYHDPGQGPFEQGTPEQCKMDLSALNDGAVGTYAVFRYGLLCHMKGADSASSMFSATKTLGGATIGRAAYLARDVPRTGPGTGPLMIEDIGTDWIATPSYSNRDATLSHIMAMVAAASTGLEDSQLTWRYDTVGLEAVNTTMQAVEKCIAQVPDMPTDFTAFVQQEIFDKMGMTSSSYNAMVGISSGWTANLTDMGKFGVMLLHDGWYGGERLLSREWVYHMTHPPFESANTSFGHLTWLNHRGNAQGIGGNIAFGSNAPQGDPCAPPAFWPFYPHGLSEAPDCLAEVGTCDQEYDVGVFSAQGLAGQFIVGHPGLDLVIVAQNFGSGDGPLGLWNAVRPAVVALDPVYQGDEAGFCQAYGNGNYAPDLLFPRHP